MTQRFTFLSYRFDQNAILSGALVACWFGGSALGLLAALRYGDAYASFLPLLAGCLPDLAGVCAAVLFPLLLSACAVYFFHHIGCFSLCLIRAVCQGFLVGLIGQCYGTAAPLMVILLMFSGLWVNGLLLFFGLRRLSLGRERFREDLTVCLCIGTAAGAVDYLVIAPFLLEVVTL